MKEDLHNNERMSSSDERNVIENEPMDIGGCNSGADLDEMRPNLNKKKGI